MKIRIYEFKACILIMFWLHVFSITAFAQAAPGTLRGQVTDPSGAVITQASVTATSSAGQKVAVTTDARGNYEFKGLSPGMYSVIASAPGFAKFETDLIISTGNLEQLDIQLATPVQEDGDDVEAKGTVPDRALTASGSNEFLRASSRVAGIDSPGCDVLWNR